MLFPDGGEGGNGNADLRAVMPPEGVVAFRQCGAGGKDIIDQQDVPGLRDAIPPQGESA